MSGSHIATLGLTRPMTKEGLLRRAGIDPTFVRPLRFSDEGPVDQSGRDAAVEAQRVMDFARARYIAYMSLREDEVGRAEDSQPIDMTDDSPSVGDSGTIADAATSPDPTDGGTDFTGGGGDFGGGGASGDWGGSGGSGGGSND